MSISAKKRIMKEIGMMQRPENMKTLNDSGIYYQFNEDNFHNVKVMMMGPRDTPYSDGYYFFDVNFPNRYPIDPPKVKFISLSRIRMNPNMYICGKLCLSMINTWSGPSWTACMSLSQVLVATQSLLNEYPIQNEPGYENERGQRSSKYNNVVSYANLKHHIVECLLKIPSGFEFFEDIMVERFKNNYQNIKNYMYKNVSLDNQQHHSQIYGLYINYNFQSIKDSIEIIKNKYSDKLQLNENMSSVSAPASASASAPVESPTPKDTNPKKKPSASANSFEVGHQLTSEHDNRVYEVKLCQGEKRTFKRWVLSKITNV